MTTASLPQPTLADGLVLDHVRLGLDHVRLGLDPADLDFIVEDEQITIGAGDGPLLTLHGWDRTDADAMRAAAEWFDALSTQVIHAATELRAMANSLCTACDGYGTVGPDDADCRTCSGSGTVS